ncbi:MAG TPA: Flp pilus assembly protein CpaB [Acidimicrobiia bacterium]|nr:Flp pilus assembly protein CpaB [Acidimicrobiia bacterium]
MGNRRVLILVIAVALAGLTAFLTFNYANTADERAFDGAELVKVYMVKKDIPKGMPGEKALDEGYIGQESIPRKFFPAKAITNPQSLRGQVAMAGLSTGVPIVEGSFVEPRLAQESFAQRLGKDKQAVTLAVSDVEGVARLVVPGDRVNLMLTTDKPGAPGQTAGKETQFVLQNIEVLAVGNSTTLQPGETAVQPQSVQAGQAKTVDSGLMTFAVPGIDAERVVHASHVGSIHLTLLPPDYSPAPVAPVNSGNLFS